MFSFFNKSKMPRFDKFMKVTQLLLPSVFHANEKTINSRKSTVYITIKL